MHGWKIPELSNLLISQQDEYSQLGLEWPKYAETREAFYSVWLWHRLIILSFIPEVCRRPGIKLIDIGGGKGRITTLLSSNFGMDCTNIDIMYLYTDVVNTEGKPLIPLLKSYCENKGVSIIAKDAYAEGLPFTDNTYDLVICSEVIEHLPNSPKPLLEDIHRILRKGGWLILTTPNYVSLVRRIKTLFGYSSEDPIDQYYSIDYPFEIVYRGHNREYTRDEVKYMLDQEHFTIERLLMCNYCPQDLQTLFVVIKRHIIQYKQYGFKKFAKATIRTIRLFMVQKLFSNFGDFIVIRAQK